MSYTRSTKDMIPFFRKLADDIENNELTTEQLMKAGELFMIYSFMKDSDISEEDIQKYLITGWFIYNKITPPEYDDEMGI